MAIDYVKRPAAPRTPAGGTAAVSLEQLTSRAPGLVNLYKTAKVSLEKAGLTGQRAAVYLVLDRSGSMRPYYKDGSVQHLAEQTLGLCAHLDDDGTVPVVFFSTEVDGIAEIGVDAYENRIGALHDRLGHMGRTNYHLAMQAVIDHYTASGATDPGLVIFQTDGGPSSRTAAEHVLCTAARLPLFWQFVGFGDTDSKQFDFLRRLDDLPAPERRLVDNAGFFPAGRSPKDLSDDALYANLMTEFPSWLVAAREAGVLGAGA